MNFKDILDYKNGNKNLLLLATNKNVIDKFSKTYAKVLPENILIGNMSDIKSILESDNILFIEEYGITKYKNFEEKGKVEISNWVANI